MAISYNGVGGGVPRKTAHIFAKDADAIDVTVFGSTKAGDTQQTTDIADIQNAAFEAGWRDAVISNKNYPLLGDMNGVQKTFSQQIAYVLQHGVPSWDSATTYYAYDIVNVNGVLYISTDDSNTNNNPTTLTKWAVFYDPSRLDTFANKDLSNLTSTGKTAVIDLAYELDFANEIDITPTTIDSSTHEYSVLSDGVIFISAEASGGGTAVTRIAIAYCGLKDHPWTGNGISNVTCGSCSAKAVYPFRAGDTAEYQAYATGGTTSVVVNFVPFKKS